MGPSTLATDLANQHRAAVHVDRNGLEVLEWDECFVLLGRATLGRIALTVGALPTVLPVNFKLHRDRVLFRTSRGTKTDAATLNAVVAFEVDDYDPVDHTGWSVVVTGIAREVTNPLELEAIDVTSIPRWAPAPDGRVVEIVPQLVSGRRISHELVHG